MYIYHVLIDTPSAHMIHIKLNSIFYTHVENSLTNAMCIKSYLKQKQNNNSNRKRNEFKPFIHA